MKNTEIIRNAAIQIRDAAISFAGVVSGVESAEENGDTAMKEAGDDYILASLEFMQKAVLILTQNVVDGMDSSQGNGDDSVFGPGELNYVKGQELDDVEAIEEDPEEVEE